MAEPAVGFDVKGDQMGSKDLNESEMLAIKGQLFGKLYFNGFFLFLKVIIGTKSFTYVIRNLNLKLKIYFRVINF